MTSRHTNSESDRCGGTIVSNPETVVLAKEPGDGDCRFSEIITSTWQPPSSFTPAAQSLSPSSRSQPLSSNQGARSNVMRKHELLVRSPEVAQTSSAVYLDLIKEFASN
ncbi:hypothetical protein KIW84_041819 [Lathyrus oleraceus]|uniref:Uncharacterized protein n=1 Tax=Pisum sativum TaxID=3888 RepID=A0A9D5APT9_PEA|nr:hypothetical protein KIW84_041819 [Pisum sativum]